MTTKTLRNTFLAGLLVATVWLLGGTLSQAGKPAGKGGGGGGGSVPDGRIYFQVYEFEATPFGTIQVFSGNWSMKADGSLKTFVPNYPRFGEPNRNRSVNGAWILSAEEVDGTYPNGLPRRELFAVEEFSADPDNPVKIPLTNDLAVMMQQNATIRWAHDDSFISFAAVTWTAVASGGNFTDDFGQRWLAEADVFVACVDWSTGLPEAGVPVSVLPVGLFHPRAGAPIDSYTVTDVGSLDWAPSGDRLVIEKVSVATTGIVTHSLYVVSFDAFGISNIVSLGFGAAPEWSPNGLKIAYVADNGDLAPNNAIWTVNPDGTGLFQVTSTAQNYDGHPHWSPDSAHLAFTRAKQSNQKATTTYLSNVMRVPAAGGSPVDLTKDLDDNAYASAWR
jgi:hypothetical protein